MKKNIFAKVLAVLTACVCSVSSLCTFASEISENNASISAYAAYEDYASTVIELINTARTNNGAPAFSQNSKLSAIADIRAQELTELFEVTRPDGTTLSDLLYEYGISCSALRQSIAMNDYSPEEMAKQWLMNSSLYSETYNEIAVGVAEYDGSLYWILILMDELTQAELDEYVSEIVRIVNEHRVANGIDPIEEIERIDMAADARAQELTEYYSHTRPDGTSCFTVFDEYAISYGYAGENIAMGQRSPEEVMEAWMNSEGHRANILGVNYDSLGVGVACANGRLYWVQLFASDVTLGEMVVTEQNAAARVQNSSGSTKLFLTLSEAMAYAQTLSSATVTLIKNATVKDSIEITAGNTTVDLNGYFVNFTADYLLVLKNSSASVKIKDSTNSGGFFDKFSVSGTSISKVLARGYRLMYESGDFVSYSDSSTGVSNTGTTYILGVPDFETHAEYMLPDDGTTLYYNGEDRLGEITVMLGGQTLEEGVDYTIEYTRNGVVTTDFATPGVIDVKITGLSPYSGEIIDSFVINKCNLNYTAYWLKFCSSYYDGTEKALVTKVSPEVSDEFAQDINGINIVENPGDFVIEYATGTGEIDYSAGYASYHNIVWGEYSTTPLTGCEPGVYLIKLRVSHPLYADYIMEHHWTINKSSVAVDAAPTASAIYYGQTLADSIISGGKVVNSKNTAMTVEGTWTWTDNTIQPLESGSFGVGFTPNATDLYNESANASQLDVEVSAAQPLLTVSADKISAQSGDVITLSVDAKNAYDSTLTEGLPTEFTYKYQIGDAQTVAMASNTFIVPDNIADGTVITFYATSAAVDGKYTECTAKTAVSAASITSIEVTQNPNTETANFFADDKKVIITDSYIVMVYFSNGNSTDITADCIVSTVATPNSLFWHAYDLGGSHDFTVAVVYNGTDSAVNAYCENKGSSLLGSIPVSIAQRGDANLDYVVDTRDAAAMAKYSSTKATLGPNEPDPTMCEENDALAKEVSDVNGDGVIDTRDAACAAKYASMSANDPETDKGKKDYNIWSEIVTLN